MNKYDFIGKIRLIYSLILTKLFYKKARLIRQPFDIRGKTYIEFGEGFTTGVGCRLEAYPEKNKKVLKIGKNVQINDYVHIAAKEEIIIEDNVLIASKVFITDLNHGSYNELGDSPNIVPIKRKLYSNPVIIKENTWIGENVSILPGTVIGRGCIIGANSVIKGEIAEFSIIVGNPAKVIKRYNTDENKWERI